MKKIGLFVKVDLKATKKADELEKWLRAKGIDVVRSESLLPSRKLSDKNRSNAPSDLFCVFVLGGDGTFLSAVQWIGNQNIPIHGIKFGKLGFLAETAEDELFSVAETILNNQFVLKPRMRLLVRVIRGGKKVATETVLNDVVINKGALARLAQIKTYININVDNRILLKNLSY